MNALTSCLIAAVALLAGAPALAENAAPTPSPAVAGDYFVIEADAALPFPTLSEVNPEALLYELPEAEQTAEAPAIPEPVGVGLLAAGMGAMMLMRRRLG